MHATYVWFVLVQLMDVQNATAAYVQQLIETLAARGKYLWQAFAGCVLSHRCLVM